MASDIEKEYNKLAKKHPNLPNYPNLDKEFDIEMNIGDKEIPSRNILRGISNACANYLHFFIDYLHNTMFPNQSSLITMEEAKIFNEEEKKKIEIILKKLVYLSRLNISLVNLKNEKEDAEFITKIYRDWKTLKKQIQPLLEKSRDHWKS